MASKLLEFSKILWISNLDLLYLYFPTFYAEVFHHGFHQSGTVGLVGDGFKRDVEHCPVAFPFAGEDACGGLGVGKRQYGLESGHASMERIGLFHDIILVVECV